MVGAFLVVALSVGVAHAQECPQVITRSALAFDLGAMQAAWRGGDFTAFQAGGASIEAGLVCLVDPLTPAAFATIYKLLGFAHYTKGELEAAEGWFRASMELIPVSSWADTELPQGHPAGQLWESVAATHAIQVVPVEGRSLLRLKSGRFLLDGRPITRPAATLGCPHLLQQLDGDGRVTRSWLFDGIGFPEAALASEGGAPQQEAPRILTDLPSQGPNLRTRGSAWTEVASDTRWTDETGEDNLEILTRFNLDARWNTPQQGRLVLGVTGEHCLRRAEKTRGQWNAWPDEVYLDQPIGKVSLRVGQQQARWGRLEATPLVDVLTPRDLRYGPMLSYEEARVPVPMVRLDMGHGAVRAQAYVIPFHVPDRFDFVGSDWAFFPTGFWKDLMASGSTWGGDPQVAAMGTAMLAAAQARLSDADPSTWWGLNASSLAGGQIWKPADNLEGALRVGWEGSRADLSAMVASVHEDFPTISLDPHVVSWSVARSWPSTEEFQIFILSGDPLVVMEYGRYQMAGLDGSLLAGAFNIRGEAAAFSRRGVVTSSMLTTTSREAGLGLGVEYTGSAILQAGAEASFRKLLDIGASEELRARRPEELLGWTYLGFSLFRERLKPRIELMLDPQRSEGLVKLDLGYRPVDRWSFALGAFFFTAPQSTPRSLEDLQAFDGGALGLYSDNDAFTGRATMWF